MTPPFAWRDEFLDLIGKQNQANLVVVANCREGQHGGNLRRQLPFRLFVRAKQTGAADIHYQHQRQFAFLDEFLDEGMIHAGRHVPINGAHLVTRLILADLVEIHPLPLEHAMVLPSERFTHEPIRANLDLPDFFKYFARNHRLPNLSLTPRFSAPRPSHFIPPTSHYGTGNSSNIF